MKIQFLRTKELVHWMLEMQWFQENTSMKVQIQVHQELRILKLASWYSQGQQQCTSRKESKWQIFLFTLKCLECQESAGGGGRQPSY